MNYMDNGLDIQQLRAQWKSMDIQASIMPEKPSIHKALQNSLLSRLTVRSKRMMTVCFLWVMLTPLCMHLVHIPLWFMIIICLYFMAMGLLMLGQLKRIRRIDLGSMSATDALISICNLQKYRRHAQCAGWTMAIPCIAGLMYCFYHINMAAFYGGLVGAVLGLIIGTVTEIRTRRELSKLRKAVHDEIYKD